MEKRLILAIALSALVLITWSAIMPKQEAIKAPVKVEQALVEQKTTTLPVRHEYPSSAVFEAKQDARSVFFVEPLGAIKEAVFTEYQNYVFKLNQGLAFVDEKMVFTKQDLSNLDILFTSKIGDKEFKKEFIFYKSNYALDFNINIKNKSASTLDIIYPIVVGEINLKDTKNQAHIQEVSVGLNEKTLHLNGRKEEKFENINFVAIKDRYFCFLVDPLNEGYSVKVEKIDNEYSRVLLIPPKLSLNPGEKFDERFKIYFGPLHSKSLQNINSAWGSIINYGTFDIISQLLLMVLEFFYKLLHNWGLAIIMLSLFIYLLLYPLTVKQMRSMKEMQALQPRIEQLKKLYKDNPQKLHKETLELYKEHKVNPFGGCLPLLLQMPVFFALYQALMRSIALKGASFLWIKDLSEPDRLFLLPFSLPLLGNEINILPIIMAITMFFQQKISMTNASSEYAEQQKMMLIIFPLIFAFIFYHMPAGLVLYWFVNSLLTVFYQFRVSRGK